MAFERPSLQEIVDRVKSDLESRLTGGAPALRRSFIAILSRVLGGGFHLLYGFLDWASKQPFPDSADEENLLRLASIWGVLRKEATYSELTVTFTGSNGVTIPEGSEMQRSDGVLFVVNADVTISGGTATASVTSVDPGDATNTDVGTALTLTSPIAGVTSQGTVASFVSEAEDEETVEALRARLIDRIQNPPQGGAATDFERWALEVPGVTRAWVYPENEGLGTVGISFVRDDDVDIFPSVGEVAEVQEYIDDRRPVTIDATVFAPTPLEVDFTISVTPNTVAVKAAVEAELEDLLKRVGEPGGTVLLSQIREAVSIAAGETDNEVTVPAADVVAGAGELPVMGTITWS